MIFFLSFLFRHGFSLKMLMVWRSLQLKNCASTIPKILELSVVLEDSITYMVPLEHGKVEFSLEREMIWFIAFCTIIIASTCNVYCIGGREKAPAAFCRKALTSTDRFEMWGDGLQTRSFTFIDECVEGVLR